MKCGGGKFSAPKQDSAAHRTKLMKLIPREHLIEAKNHKYCNFKMFWNLHRSLSTKTNMHILRGASYLLRLVPPPCTLPHPVPW